MIKELKKISSGDREILDRYTAHFPVKLGALAKDLGVSIKVSSLDIGISGKILKYNGHYIIKINRNEARERQRFTIGHELAHYLIHRHVIDGNHEGIVDTVLYRSGAPAQIEYEANRLGAEIVMPALLVKKVLKDDFRDIITEETIERLANRFEVSRAAMEVRLSNLSRDAS